MPTESNLILWLQMWEEPENLKVWVPWNFVAASWPGKREYSQCGLWGYLRGGIEIWQPVGWPVKHLCTPSGLQIRAAISHLTESWRNLHGLRWKLKMGSSYCQTWQLFQSVALKRWGVLLGSTSWQVWDPATRHCHLPPQGAREGNPGYRITCKSLPRMTHHGRKHSGGRKGDP